MTVAGRSLRFRCDRHVGYGVDGRALLCCLVFSVHDNPAQGAAMLRFCCSIPCTDCTVFDLNISQATAASNSDCAA